MKVNYRRQIMVKKPTYKQIIISKLLSGEIISPLTTLKDFGCLSLAQRISELRQQGYPIQGKLVKIANGKKYNIYWLEKADIKRLKKEK